MARFRTGSKHVSRNPCYTGNKRMREEPPPESNAPVTPPSSPTDDVAKKLYWAKCPVCHWEYERKNPTPDMSVYSVATCNTCISKDTTACTRCKRTYPDELGRFIMVCEICELKGSTCFDCVGGITEPPKGLWFCSAACTEMGGKRAVPAGYIQPNCTFTVADGKPGAVQYFRNCVTCKLNDVCMSCISTCHAGHETGPYMHKSGSCVCGSNSCCRPAVVESEAFTQLFSIKQSIISIRAELADAEAAISAAEKQANTYDSMSKVKLALIPPAEERAKTAKLLMDQVRGELTQKSATCSTAELEALLVKMRPLEAELRQATEKLDALIQWREKMAREIQEVHNNKAVQEEHATKLRQRLAAAIEQRAQLLASDAF